MSTHVFFPSARTCGAAQLTGWARSSLSSRSSLLPGMTGSSSQRTSWYVKYLATKCIICVKGRYARKTKAQMKCALTIPGTAGGRLAVRSPRAKSRTCPAKAGTVSTAHRPVMNMLNKTNRFR
jgi:hypothetical protein